ncbi:MAG TPA: glycosyltransferase family 2 protein [Gaiellaceae bacterium]
MIESKHVAVVIPAYNEEKLLETTVAGIPAFVDRVYIVDDASRDATVGRAHTAASADPRITVIVHERNRGAGAAVVTGYKRALEDGADIACVMNADNQMDPAELSALVMPVANDEVDYTKANRLFTGEAWDLIPHYRYLGNALLSLLTKIASGYWHVADSQAGYTAINRRMLELVDLDNVYPRYGYPNDMLVHLNVWSARVRDIPSRPIYGVGEQSGIKLRSVVPRISWLLMKGFVWRMGHRYVIRDFHPLVFFYMAGFFSFLIGLTLGSYTIARHFSGNPPTPGLATIVALMMTFSLLFTLFAMWFDMETNKDLK